MEYVKRKFQKVDAMYTPGDGALECLASHIKALESVVLSEENDAVWVCEDDIKFLVSQDELDVIIESFMKSDAHVLCLSFASRNHKTYINMSFLQTFDTQTASSYIVKKSALNDLLDLWKSVYKCRVSKTQHPRFREFHMLPVLHGDFYCVDMAWKLFQQQYVFVIPLKKYAEQRESFSDITNKIEKYNC